MSPGKDPYDEPLHRTGLGLGAGCLLGAAGVAVIVLDLFPLLTRYGVAIALIVAALILIGNEILRLRKRPDRGQLLWTALLDAILVAAIVLAIAPFAALGRGFADLVVGWLFAFWIFVQRWILKPDPAYDLEEAAA
jgi:hypothetical protein